MLTIERVKMDCQEMAELVSQGHRVRETPHLGGPHNGKYALTLGGLASDVVLVDTTKAARDRFGKTQDVAGTRFVSNKQGERIPAAALHRVTLSETASAELVNVMGRLGINDTSRFYANGLADIAGLHVHCVEEVVAQGTFVTTFAELWRQTGDAGQAMMEHIASQGLFTRWHDTERGQIVEVGGENQCNLLRREGSYFDSRESTHGVLPPVEAMLAIEAVLAAAEGREVTYDHLYVMSTEYTKDVDTHERIRNIALGTLAILGLSNVDVRYRYIIADNTTLDAIGGDTDHFAMMRNGLRFDAMELLRNGGTDNV